MGFISGREGGKTLWQKMTEKKPEPIDSTFPLGIRIPSRVNFDITNYYLGEGKLKMDRPAEKGSIIRVEVIVRDNDMIDYFSRIASDYSTGVTFLFVETQAGKVLATKLFTQMAEIYPESEDEWDSWIDSEVGILGGELLTAPNGEVYERIWGSGKRVEPLCAEEVLYQDKFGKNKITNHLMQMMFARVVCDESGNRLTDEFALVSVVNEKRIDILLGVPVAITDGDIVG